MPATLRNGLKTVTYDDQTTSNDRPAFIFAGFHTRSVDKKGRFNLPQAFRPDGESKFVVNRGPKGVLTVLPYTLWLEKFRNIGRDKTRAERREAKRKMSLTSQIVEPDQQGRIAVAPSALEAAGIAGKIMIVGVDKYMELWPAEALEPMTVDEVQIDEDVIDEFFD